MPEQLIEGATYFQIAATYINGKWQPVIHTHLYRGQAASESTLSFYLSKIFFDGSAWQGLDSVETASFSQSVWTNHLPITRFTGFLSHDYLTAEELARKIPLVVQDLATREPPQERTPRKSTSNDNHGWINLWSDPVDLATALSKKPKVVVINAYCNGRDYGPLVAHDLQLLTAHEDLEELQLLGPAIAEDDLALLAPLVRLERVLLVGKWTDAAIERIAKLPALDSLALHSPWITDQGIVAVASIPKLKYLSLRCPLLTDTCCQVLESLQKLEHLTIHSAQISDQGLSSIRTLPHLKKLNLSCPKLTDESCKFIGALSQLESLIITDGNFSDKGLSHFRELRRLKSLTLTDPLVTDDGLLTIGDMSQLEELEISSSRITDSGLQNLTQLSRLNSLQVYGTSITEQGATEFTKELPSCRVFGSFHLTCRTLPPINIDLIPKG